MVRGGGPFSCLAIRMVRFKEIVDLLFHSHRRENLQFQQNNTIQTLLQFVGSEVLSAAVLKSLAYRDTPCSPLKVNQRFGLICRFHLQVRSTSISQARNQRASRWQVDRHVPPKRRLAFNGLHGSISQKILLFITIAARSSNLMKN